MYDARQTDLGPPLPYHADQVRQIGADKFVGWLTVSRISFWQCRNLHKHIYAIGWFGDVWHLDLIAKWLDHENPEVRRCALAAFSRLTNQKFESEAAASSWWSEHNSDFPRFEPDERTLLDSNNEKEK